MKEYSVQIRKSSLRGFVRNLIFCVAISVIVYFTGQIIFAVTSQSIFVGKTVFIILVLATVGLLLVPFGVQISRGEEIDVFAPSVFILGFFGITYLLRPLQMVLSGDYELIYPAYAGFSTSTLVAFSSLALLYINIGAASFLFGYYARWGRRFSAVLPLPNSKWRRGQLWVGVVGYTFVSIISFLIVIQFTTGSVIEFIGQWSDRSQLLAGFHLFSLLSRASALSSIGLLIYYQRLHPTIIGHFSLSMLLVLTYGRRAFALTLVLMFIIAYHYSIRKLRIYQLIPIGLGLFSIAGIVQGLRTGELNNLFTYLLNLPTDLFVELADDLGRGFDNFVLLLWGMPERWGHQFGTTFLRVPFNFVPRAFWAEKPSLTVGGDFADIFFEARSGGVPPGFLALQYLNFHVIGIVLGMFLYGACFRSFYEYLKKAIDNPAIILLYAVTLVHFRKGINNNNLFIFLITISIVGFFILLVSSKYTTLSSVPSDERSAQRQ